MRSEPTSLSFDGEMERESILNELVLMTKEIEISQGRGNLIILVVNEPYLRDLAVDFVENEFKVKKIIITKGEQVSRIKEGDFDVCLWQLPESVGPDILNALNFRRELFYETGFPSVVICNEGVLDAIIRDAPDFWRYKASYHVLKGMKPMFQSISDLSFFDIQEKEKKDLFRQIEISEYLLPKVTGNKQRAFLISEEATLYLMLGEYETAMKYYSESLKIFEELHDLYNIASVCHNLGTIHQLRGEYEKAVAYFTKSLELKEALHDVRGIASTFHNLGIIHQDRGEYEKAVEYFTRSLEISEELHDVGSIARTYHQLGTIHQLRGEYEKAVAYFTKSLELKEALHDVRGIASTFHNLGIIHQDRGEYEKAVEYFTRSLEISEELHDVGSIASSCGQLGRLYIEKREYEKALKLLLVAHDIFHSIHSPSISLTEKYIAEIRHQLGEK